MSQKPEKQPEFITTANKLSEEVDADILIYNGELQRSWDTTVIELCSERNRRPNVILYLVTEGGDPDAAFRIAACLQKKYQKFIISIPGYCKSAGTIVAIGAHEVIVSDNGELGPLDVQLAKQDELWQFSSGLNVDAALDKLQERTLQSLEHYFLPLTQRSGGRITTKTAMQIAKDLVVGLYGKVFEQIDPTRIGEVSRAMNIAAKYGEILNKVSGNLKEGALEQLATGYPDHGFVLDRDQIKELFEHVRGPSPSENSLTIALGNLAKKPVPITKTGRKPIVFFLSQEAQQKKEVESNENKGNQNPEGSTGNQKQAIGQTREDQRSITSPRDGELQAVSDPKGNGGSTK